MKERIVALGECALIVRFSNTIDREAHRRGIGFTKLLQRDAFPGFQEAVPTYATVAVYYDPLIVARSVDPAFREDPQAQVRRWLQEKLELVPISEGWAAQPSKTVSIPVCYCPVCGPDLPSVAAHNALSLEEVIGIHSSVEYTVYMVGFLPGFPYLGGMPEKLATPRLSAPRIAVPAGSVGIAGHQTGIYPVSSPGGWRLIGRTAAVLFDAERDPPSFLSAGDTVRFEPASHNDIFPKAGVGAE